MTRDVARLRNRTFDVLVIGGGIYGLIVAADAAERGLSVALVERDDFGSGSSFNHLRTIHGGLRYLQSLDLARARESIAERRTLARIAPQYVRPLPFVLPLAGGLARGPMAMRAGFLLDRAVARARNDGLPPSHHLPPGSVLSGAEARRRFPAASDGRRPAAVWYDYVVTEADRLTLAWAIAAAGHGAVLANHVKAAQLIGDGPRIVGARVNDLIAGDMFEVAARVVVNATGGAVDTLLQPSGLQTGMPVLCAMNLVTRLAGGPAAAGAHGTGGRALFMVPWQGRALFGTWETQSRQDAPQRQDDIDAFVRAVAAAFPAIAPAHEDVTLVHRGLVPAVADGRGGLRLEGRQRICDHATGDHATDGLITVAGTKYTTARATAEKVTDLIVAKLARAAAPCRTATLPLPATARDAGAPGPGASAVLPPDVLEHLSAVFGPAADAVRAVTAARPDLAARVSDHHPAIGAQLAWAARHEMAVTLADAVIRRTSLGALGHPGEATLARAARVMAAELGWNAERSAAEIRAVDGFYRRAAATAAG